MAKKKTPVRKAAAKKKAAKKAAPAPVPAAAPVSSAAFATILQENGQNGPPPAPLVNITFFLGAGFSKAWDARYPTGNQLFSVPGAKRDSLSDVERASSFSGPIIPADLDPDHIRQMVYTLDMNARYPAIRPRYADDHSIEFAARQLRGFFGLRLQEIVGPEWSWFDEADRHFVSPAPFTPAQENIRALFSRMFSLIDGSQGHMQGARFNFVTTNYDWLLERITDDACAHGDSAFLYLYRGVTPDLICGLPPAMPAFSHSLVFNLLKLNGGLEVFRENGRYHFDYRVSAVDRYRENPPVLILPSREQNYQDDYFLAVFPKAVRLLQESAVLVLVGYSLPDDDALLRFIIRQFCEDAADAHSKAVFYVDPCPEARQLDRLRSVFPFAGKTLRTHTYSGGFADWASEVVAQL